MSETENKTSRECVSHHFACDCREAAFSEIKRENVDLKRIIDDFRNQTPTTGWPHEKKLHETIAALEARLKIATTQD